MYKTRQCSNSNYVFALTLVITFGSILGVSTPLSAQTEAKFEEQLDALVKPYLDNKKFVGASVGVFRKGKIITRSYGQYSDSDATKPNADTIYEIGSISKVFTGVLLADAVNQKKLKLDQTLGSLVKGMESSDENGAATITLQQLSQHMSGLPPMPTNIAPKDPNNPFDGYDREMLLEYLKKAKTTNPPGQNHTYSNLGVGLLGDLLSQQSGESLESLLKDRIFESLEMSDTSIIVDDERMKRFAPPYNAALMKDTRWDFDALAGCGAIRSSVNDMLKFIQANIDSPDDELGAALDLAWKKQLNQSRQHAAMGLGWMIAGDGSTRWHNGQTGGYQTMMLVSRPGKTGVVLLSNTAGSEVDLLGQSIFQLAVGMDVKPRKFANVIKVEEEFVKRLAGKYQLAPNVTINITANGNRLSAQITGQQALQIEPESNTVWNYKLVKAQLVFDVPESGSATKVTLLQNGRTMPCARIDDGK